MEKSADNRLLKKEMAVFSEDIMSDIQKKQSFFCNASYKKSNASEELCGKDAVKKYEIIVSEVSEL